MSLFHRAAPRLAVVAGLACIGAGALAAERDEITPPEGTSYAPVVIEEEFDEIMQRLSRDKQKVMRRQQQLLEERYDLSDNADGDATMSRGKPVQSGVRAKLPRGVDSWQALAEMSPDEIRERDLFPAGFMALPHPKHQEGGMVFPQFQIDETQRQEGRDLARFDVDFDIPDHFLPEFPPAIFLTPHKHRGDVSQGQLVTLDNFFELFDGILTPKQIEGVRLLVTPFPQQQFNATHDRRSEEPSQGVTCFDCHANGHTNAATHLAGDARPTANRNRIDVPTLRGVNVQQLFGSQRALKTVEDFTEFEQRGAYFDGDIVLAAKKGVNVLDRGSQVQHMAEFQEMLDFPPAPKLDPFGRLDHSQASEQEIRGESVFFGKGRCAECHAPPHYTDNTMHDLKIERFFEPREINGRMANALGPIKTFPLRGIKDSPPYLHDGRLLTLHDTVEFFNLILGTQLEEQEKDDLVAFMLAL